MTSFRSQRGQGLAEYLIILVAVAVCVLLITVVFGGKIKQLLGIADAEVETLGEANLSLEGGSYGSGGGSGGAGSGGSGSGGSGSGGSGSGSGGSGSGGDPDGGGYGGGGDDGWGGGGPEFGPDGGGRGSGSGAGRGGSSARGSSADGMPGGADGDGIARARGGRSGIHTVGEGDDQITVYAPGADEKYKGSAKYDRQSAERAAMAEREEDARRWDKKRRAAWDAPPEGEGSSVGGPNLTLLLLIVLLVAAGAVGARAVFGGRSS